MSKPFEEGKDLGLPEVYEKNVGEYDIVYKGKDGKIVRGSYPTEKGFKTEGEAKEFIRKLGLSE